MAIFASVHKQAKILLNETVPAHVYLIVRVSVGVVYFWFGALKLPFVPGGSPAADLIASWRTVIDPVTFNWMLAIFETSLGALLLLGIGVRLVAAVLLLHALGTFATLAMDADQLFNRQYGLHSLTLAGQYVVKNVLLLAALFALAVTKPRRYPRWLFIVPGQMALAGREIPIITRNVSRTGLSFLLFAAATEALVPGARISLSLSLPLAAAKQTVTAKVVHRRYPSESVCVVGCKLEEAAAFLDALSPWLTEDYGAIERARRRVDS